MTTDAPRPPQGRRRYQPKVAGPIGPFVVVAAVLLFIGVGLLIDVASEELAYKPEGESPALSSAAKRWPARWCNVELGMTRDRVRGIMGLPTEDLPVESLLGSRSSRLEWEESKYLFTASFDAEGQVRGLDNGSTALGASEKDAVKCDPNRLAP